MTTTTFKKMSETDFSVSVDGIVVGTVRKIISYKAKMKGGKLVGNVKVTMWRSIKADGTVTEGVRSDRSAAAGLLA